MNFQATSTRDERFTLEAAAWGIGDIENALASKAIIRVAKATVMPEMDRVLRKVRSCQ